MTSRWVALVEFGRKLKNVNFHFCNVQALEELELCIKYLIGASWKGEFRGVYVWILESK